MNMKLHLVAAADIISKGLDPSYPHSDIGSDGLLVGPLLVVEEPIATVDLPIPEEVPEVVPAQVEEPVVDDILVAPEESVAKDEPEVPEEKVAEPSEEKKTAKPKGRPAKTA